MNLERTGISLDSWMSEARKYLTRAVRDASTYEANAVVVDPHATLDVLESSVGQRRDGRIKPQTHGSKRNLIALHVILNRRRTFIRR